MHLQMRKGIDDDVYLSLAIPVAAQTTMKVLTDNDRLPKKRNTGQVYALFKLVTELVLTAQPSPASGKPG